jgi:hypothetical protein
VITPAAVTLALALHIRKWPRNPLLEHSGQTLSFGDVRKNSAPVRDASG